MPVLRQIRERFEQEKPLAGIRISACLHVTTETANLAITLKAGGADVLPLRHQPALHPGRRGRRAGARLRHPHLRHQGRGQRHLLPPHQGRARPQAAHHHGRRRRPGRHAPQASATDLFAERHRRHRRDHHRRHPPARAWPSRRRARVTRSSPSTTPTTKHLFDNRYGTGQSTIDGIIRATNVLLAGKNVRGRRLRLVRPRPGHARQGHGRPRHRHRDRPDRRRSRR